MLRGTTLFSITLNLKNTAEMEIVQDAVALIMQRREHEAEERRKMYDLMALDEKGGEVTPPSSETKAACKSAAQRISAAQMAERAVEVKAALEMLPKTVETYNDLHPMADHATLAENGALPKPRKPEEMEAALRAYIARTDLAAARKLLTEFGIDRIGAVAPERQAELFARLHA